MNLAKFPKSTLALAAGLAAITVAGVAQNAEAASIIGQKVYSTGGDITLKVLPATAGYTSELHLYTPGYEQFITTNRNADQTYTLSGIPKGLELIFGIYVTNTGDTFKMGDGSRNLDALAHAAVDVVKPNKFLVGFEDLFGGGDQDYDDNVFEFTQGITTNSNGTPVPEPSTMIGTLAFSVLGGAALLKKRKSKKTLA
ncbi:PEP-CTERM sorting domain-containing protein [Merismopedia glauca]